MTLYRVNFYLRNVSFNVVNYLFHYIMHGKVYIEYSVMAEIHTNDYDNGISG